MSPKHPKPVPLAVRLLLVLAAAIGPAPAPSDARPNFLLITCEDLSPDLGCDGDPNARTPRLDALAAEGTRYTAAFANAPVCSPARSALFFSRYQHSIGSSNHRSRPDLPADTVGFAEVLADAGYFCTSGPKFDVNAADPAALRRRAFASTGGWWDDERDGRPFLAIRNLDTTHQSRTSVWPRERYEQQIRSELDEGEIHDPGDVDVPPYYPDTPEVRRELARYADCVTLMDRQAGELLDRLERDGLADDTIVFFFADHGAGHAAHKKAALARGTRVPFIVRIPEKWSHLRTAEPGGTDARPVSFVDVGPTILAAAGVDIPGAMHGRPFLGDAPSREFVFIARDRIDEDIDHARSVTDGRFFYTRAFFPHRPHLAPNGYAFPSPIYQALVRGASRGTLPEPAAKFALEPRGPELLFDLEADPHEIGDLSDDPRHAATLDRFRAALRAHMREVRDRGLIPEGIIAREPGSGVPDGSPLPIARVLDVAHTVGLGDDALPTQLAAATDPHPAVRYWAIIGLRQHAGRSSEADVALTAALADPSAEVRAEAAAAVLSVDPDAAAAREALSGLLDGDGYRGVLAAARAGQLAGLTGDAFAAGVRVAAQRWDRYELSEVGRSIDRVRAGEEPPVGTR